MPIFLVLLGVALMLLAWQDNQGLFIEQVATDFIGANGQEGFAVWFLAILVVGGLGYVKPIQGFTRGIMGLVFLVILIKGGTGFFSQLQSTVTGSVSLHAQTPGDAPTGATTTGTGNTVTGLP